MRRLLLALVLVALGSWAYRDPDLARSTAQTLWDGGQRLLDAATERIGRL